MAELSAGEIAAAGTGVLGLIQTGLSIGEKAAARKRQAALFKKRTAFQTPDETFKAVNALTNQASGGLAPAVLKNLIGEAGNAFSATLGTAQRLGGNANDLSANFNQYMNQIFKVESLDQDERMKKFGAYIGGLNMLADNKNAEWQSKENIVRDQLQAEGVRFQNANANLSSGLNTIIGAGSALAQMQLYKERGNNAGDSASTLSTVSGGIPLRDELTALNIGGVSRPSL